jgi:uncharacterized repeat protein (TIGR02543 family)
MCTLSMSGDKSVTPSFNLKQFTLSVTPNNIAGASGTITSLTSPSPAAEISCGSRCSLPRHLGDTVTLTASPAPGYYFGGWGGDCAGDTPTCNLTMTAAHSATVNFTPANLIFTTAGSYTQAQVKSHGTPFTDGKTQMVTGADALCAAAGAPLTPSPSPSTWKAVIGTWEVSAASRIAGARGWVRPDGKPFADTSPWGFHSAVLYPPRITEGGAMLGGGEMSWTGITANGDVPNDDACTDWTQPGAQNLLAGVAAGGSSEWAQGFVFAAAPPLCNGSFHILCMQVDYTAVVPRPSPPAAHRYLFVTDSPVSADATITGFTAACSSQSNGLPGTYHALVSFNGTAAAGFFTPHGYAVVRPDGVVVANVDADLLGGALPDVPVNVTATLQYLDLESFAVAGYVFTGASSPAVKGTIATTCSTGGSASWNTTSGTMIGGWSTEAGADWFNDSGTEADCTRPHRLYCLQD